MLYYVQPSNRCSIMFYKSFYKSSTTHYLILCLTTITLARILPHPPNFTPLISLCLLSSYFVKRWYWGVVIILITLLVSDIFLSVSHNYLPFGRWSLFTYSGFFMIAWFAYGESTINISPINIFQRSMGSVGSVESRGAMSLMGAMGSTRPTWLPSLTSYLLVSLLSLAYWLWTNFGVWSTTHWYPKTIVGLIECYVVALPFLSNAWLGDMIWLTILFIVMKRLSLSGLRKNNNAYEYTQGKPNNARQHI